jgi:hypothetical protein
MKSFTILCLLACFLVISECKVVNLNCIFKQPRKSGGFLPDTFMVDVPEQSFLKTKLVGVSTDELTFYDAVNEDDVLTFYQVIEHTDLNIWISFDNTKFESFVFDDAQNYPLYGVYSSRTKGNSQDLPISCEKISKVITFLS